MEMVYASAAELAAAIVDRTVSATDVVTAHLARIDACNPSLNAVVVLDADGALRRAREADEALERGEVWGPLHGVPFTLKDAHATAGLRTTSGYPQLADHVPAEDGTVATRLKAAGGILLGKTNVPVMLGDYQSNNPIFGRTSNPWDVDQTPGGSSGGAAAAVAAGMVPFDIGTDLAGSIRVPAHFCGVFGLKPTEHRVSLFGLVPGMPPPRPIRLMSCVGPLARTVEDLTLLYEIIAGPDGLDTDVPPVPLGTAEAVDLDTLRVAIAPTFSGFPVAEEIRQAIHELAAKLAQAGAEVEEAQLPELDFSRDVASVGELVMMLTGANRPSEQPPTLGQYLGALHDRDQSIIAWERFFDAWDVLLCPASMCTAFPHCDPGTPLTVDGQRVSYWAVSAHSALFNYTGHPAVVLPCGLDRQGLPIGLQLVARRWADSRLLAIASAFSPIAGGFQRPPSVTNIER
jgi:amidase